MPRILLVNNTSVYVHRFRRQLIERLGAAGHEVVLVCPTDAHTHKLNDLGVERIDWPLRQHGTHPWSELKAAEFLARTAKRVRPQVVLNFTLKPAIYGSFAARRCSAQSCFSVFTGLGYYFTDPARFNSLPTRAMRGLLKLALPANDAVFFQNPADRDLFVRMGLIRADRTRIVDGSGVDTRHFQPSGDPVVPGSFVLVGRMLAEKGVREFVAAARSIRAVHPHSRFWLVGGIDTSSSAITREEIRAWEREKTIEYFGEVDDVRPIVGKASALVLPSYREGMPRSVLEGMAMGKAVVVTDVPGCSDCVTDGVNGLVVPPANSQALAAAMSRLLVDSGLGDRMGAMSRQIAVERYDVQRINTSFLKACGLISATAV